MRKQIHKAVALFAGIGASLLVSGQTLAAPASLAYGNMPGYTPASMSRGYATFRPRYAQRSYMPAHQARPYYYFPQPAALNSFNRFRGQQVAMPGYQDRGQFHPGYRAVHPASRNYYAWGGPSRVNPAQFAAAPVSRYTAPAYRQAPVMGWQRPGFPVAQMAHRPLQGNAMNAYRFRPWHPARTAMKHQGVQRLPAAWANPGYRFRPLGRQMVQAKPAYAPGTRLHSWNARQPAFNMGRTQYRPGFPVAAANYPRNNSQYRMQPRFAYGHPGVYRFRPDARFVNPVQTRGWPAAQAFSAPQAPAYWQQRQHKAYKWRPLGNVAENGLAQVEGGNNF
ncbi:MAG: hypothetical protein ABW088_16950 [Sedimenticola sp.]